MSEFICSYCEAKLASRGSLLNHIHKNKKCIIKQLQLGVIEEEITYCKHCEKKYKTEEEYNEHLNMCKISLSVHYEELNKLRKEELNNLRDQLNKSHNEEITKLKEEINSLKTTISRYEGQIEGMSKGTVINNTTNTTNNNNTYTSNNNKTFNQANLNTIIGAGIDFTDKKRFADIINNQYTIREFNGGVEKTAEFIASKLLVDDNGKLQYVSKSDDRNDFYFRDKNKNDEIVKDPRNEILFDVVEKPLINKCLKIKNEEIFKSQFEEEETDLVLQINNIEKKIAKINKEFKKMKEDKKKKVNVDEKFEEKFDEYENKLQKLNKDKKYLEESLSEDSKENLENNKMINRKCERIVKGFETSSKMGTAIRKVNQIKLNKIIDTDKKKKEGKKEMKEKEGKKDEKRVVSEFSLEETKD